ncbi:ABC transporter substrate-binding protein [Trueperella pecoris]|uniref:ABC transporter substrate-binding protein n=1 Tax=Trueperella pecoris TaxID=2733571 RepID=UPI00186B81AE|nr:ABC transporter substrate-binding protein [Trueperella pecoris]QOQ38579.1 carbohydrate ABC transporter substrate-binding protein [Trueperella pecoris]
MASTKKILALIAAGGIALAGLAGCSSDDKGKGNDGAGSVYFLNWKPEQEAAYQTIAKAYTEETGVKVTVATAASGTYEQTLKTEITKSAPPTLFQINGPVGLSVWKDYAADISDAEFTKNLTEDNLALKGGDGKTYGVPLAIEGYGIIYNAEIMDKYFAMDGAKATSMDEVTTFDKLKAVADDMQAKKAELGIDGVFASTSLAPGEEWRWQTHLSNIPMYYEYKADNVTDKQAVDFKYNENFKNIFELYLTDSTIEKTLTPSKTVSDSMAEFATGKAAMVQNGNWAWSQISEVAGNVVKEDKIKFLPIYTGMPDDAKQGLAIGTEAFMAINAKASEADQKATIDFVNWLFSSEKGKQFVVKDLGFMAPFKTFGKDEFPTDPLAKEIQRYLTNDAVTNVPWVFTTYPSQNFKDQFAQALAQYASGNMEWSAVAKTFVDAWAAEKK